MKFFLCIFFALPLFGDALPELAALAIKKPPAEKKEACAALSPRPMLLSLRYTSPRGIGYNPGYTTLEGFFFKMYGDDWLPFLDLRGHVFDNGKFAANVGLGLRYMSRSRVWGINGYYDYRNTDRQHYNQAALGFECLGDFWDVRLNGYLPVGKTASPLRAKFECFSGHTMYLRLRRDAALKGVNLEGGLHVDRFKAAPLYFAGGPYYLTGKTASAWGGQLRAAVDLCDRYLRIEGNLSYDHFFKWIGQGQISINVPFGRREKRRAPVQSCHEETVLYDRALQRIDRFEIIPVAGSRATKAAIDPSTGEPYFFVFVDNMSSSLGTYESPYGYLSEAQTNSSAGNIIYIFPGDGTSNKMNGGISLKDAQQLLGASTVHRLATTVGQISIPPLASAMPILTNTTTNPVITLANDNLVSGLYIENANGSGISGASITNFTALQNSIVGGGVSAGSGEAMLFNDISGELVVNNNYFFQSNPTSAQGYAIHIAQTTAQCNATIVDDTIVCQRISMMDSYAANGIFADLSGTGSIGTLNMAGTVLSSDTSEIGYAIVGDLSGSSFISSLLLSDVDIKNWEKVFSFDLSDSSSIGNLAMSGSTLYENVSGFYGSLAAGSSIQNFSISNSTVYGSEYPIVTEGAGTIGNLTISNSIFSENTFTVWPINQTINQLNIFNNQFTNNSYSFYTNSEYPLPAIGQGSFRNNQCVNSPVVILTEGGSFSTLSLANNTFTTSSPASAGYAVSATTNGASMLCLDFVGNTSTPPVSDSYDPYVFTQTEGNFFNLTSESTQENNTGTISESGTFGNCSL